MARKAGRPELKPSEKRDAVFRFVTTKAEARKIRQRAGEQGLSLSEYLRRAAIPRD